MRLKIAALAATLFLFSQPVFAREGFVKTADGVRLFYDYNLANKEKGAVILLHGWGMSYAEWATFSAFLNAKGYSTVAIDFRGHGASTEKGNKTLNYQKFSKKYRIKMLQDIKAAAGIVSKSRNVWIVGSSFGASLGFSYAVKNRSIRGVVLLSPSMKHPAVYYNEQMQRYGRRPIFLSAAKKDKACYQASLQLKKRARGRSRFIYYKDNTHGTGLLNKPTLKDDILRFMNG